MFSAPGDDDDEDGDDDDNDDHNDDDNDDHYDNDEDDDHYDNDEDDDHNDNDEDDTFVQLILWLLLISSNLSRLFINSAIHLFNCDLEIDIIILSPTYSFCLLIFQ